LRNTGRNAWATLLGSGASLRAGEGGDLVLEPGDFYREDSVGAAGENVLGDGGVESVKGGGGVLDVFERDVEIGFGASDEDGRALEVHGVAGDVGRADERAAESADERVAARVAGGVFKGQARALGKADEADAFGGDAGVEGFADMGVDAGEGAGEPRFVLGGWNEETMWIPGMVRGLGGDVGEVGGVEKIDKTGDVFGGGTASVEEDHDAAGFGQRGAEAEGRGGVVEVHGGGSSE